MEYVGRLQEPFAYQENIWGLSLVLEKLVSEEMVVAWLWAAYHHDIADAFAAINTPEEEVVGLVMPLVQKYGYALACDAIEVTFNAAGNDNRLVEPITQRFGSLKEDAVVKTFDFTQVPVVPYLRVR